MARLMTMEGADEAVTQEVKVANGIQNFVFDELVLLAEAVFVQHAVVINHDRVVQATAEREVASA